MSKTKQPASMVLQSLSKALHYANKLPADDPSKPLLMRNLESQIKDLLPDNIKETPHLHGIIAATGSDPLIDEIHSRTGKPFEIDRQSWSKLISISSPERIEALVEDKISVKNSSCALLQASLHSNRDWTPILDLFEARRVYEKDILTDSRVGLLTHPGLAHPVSRFLRGQIRIRPEKYEDHAKNALSHNDLLRAMLIHLAGMPISRILNTPPSGLSKSLGRMTLSSHGQLALMGILSGLEAVLENPERIQKLQRALERS